VKATNIRTAISSDTDTQTRRDTDGPMTRDEIWNEMKWKSWCSAAASQPANDWAESQSVVSWVTCELKSWCYDWDSPQPEAPAGNCPPALHTQSPTTPPLELFHAECEYKCSVKCKNSLIVQIVLNMAYPSRQNSESNDCLQDKRKDH